MACNAKNIRTGEELNSNDATVIGKRSDVDLVVRRERSASVHCLGRGLVM